jgi:hypothetical protein
VLSGFTIVRNAVTLDFPIVPAIRSILPICDEVVVNVGRSDDGTRELVAAIGDPRIRIQDSVWDASVGGATLAVETNRAMAACRGTWGVYVQADEVLHETGAAILRDAVQTWDRDDRVEGLLVDYHHFYGDLHTVATNRHWYRREVRVVRLGRDIRSYGDAQGFRVGDEPRRVRARPTGAQMFHYGWARPPEMLRHKHAAFQELFTELAEKIERRRALPQLEWTPGLRRFTGRHPAAAAQWVAERDRAPAGSAIGPRRLRFGDVRYYLSDWIERLTGARVFEYRNYVRV